MTIKALPSFYKGQQFRSRLEARWAIFFDLMNIEWEYEPEGYMLEDLGPYLPDFYLPNIRGGTFVEIKPRPPNMTGFDLFHGSRWFKEYCKVAGKLFHLSYDTKQNALFCIGRPGEFEFLPFHKRCDVGLVFAHWAKFTLPKRNGIGWLDIGAYREGRRYIDCYVEPYSRKQNGGWYDYHELSHIPAQKANGVMFNKGKADL